uniref:Uncharacterized protein n=1 Tax=Cacopsylla melanoneura TaxID=428564 RepID=A0A8D8ZWK1_9HEMI
MRQLSSSFGGGPVIVQKRKGSRGKGYPIFPCKCTWRILVRGSLELTHMAELFFQFSSKLSEIKKIFQTRDYCRYKVLQNECLTHSTSRKVAYLIIFLLATFQGALSKRERILSSSCKFVKAKNRAPGGHHYVPYSPITAICKWR